jgi:alkanesulfonate monooxygenase SsuD/methylene tetrahydromethanopterin reductase-like flavin-dependent oxidoreductase (luciferase family)
MRPHNLTLVMAGAGLLWFGWLGFNAGSALGANGEAAEVLVTTLLAMAAATLQALSGGRFWLGLGSSTEVIVEDWMGLRLERPLARVRETVEAVRLALSGEKVAYQGATLRLRDFRLQLGACDVPIVVGALGPRMLRLAGEVADGVALSYAALPGLPAQLAEAHAGLAAAGRQVADFDVVQRLGVAVDEDEEQLLPALRREIAGYGRSRAYNQSFARQGYPDEARGMWQAWQRRDGRAAMRAVSDRLLADTFVFGDVEACRARLAAYRAAGLRTPVVVPISVHPDARERQRRRRRTLEALATLRSG